MGADQPSEDATTWSAAATPPPPSPLNYDLDVDVCVIGGGLAGLTAAREVARRGWSVALLEAQRIGSRASGRNGGVVLPGFSAPVEKIVERIGAEATRGLWELSQTGVQYVRDTIADSGDAGIIEGRGCLQVSKWPDQSGVAARVALLAEMGLEAEGWQAEQVREVLRTSRYFDAVHVPAALLINPLAYARALGAAAVQAGARIFEHTPVIAADLAGIRKRIDTPRARVRANHVVLAGNVHLGTIVPSLAGTLVPVTGYVGVTRPLGKPLAHAIAFRGAVNSSRRASDHYRVVNGDRLLWSGTVAGAIWARKSLAQVISSTYPQLGPVLFEHFWPVQTGFAVHGMPQIGEVQRGVWLASAFGGQGLNTSAMAGDLVARAIVEGDDAWKRFLPFELVWAGGAAGRTVARTAAWWQRRSEDVLAFAARQREEFQRSKEEQKSRAKSAEIKPADVKSPAGESPDGKSASAGIKLPGLKLAGAGFRNLKLAIPSARDAVPVLKRVLKGSPAADDRPIDAPEAVPAADEAKRDPGSGIEG